MRISRFEEIEAWIAARARKLVNCVYEAIRLNHTFRRDFRLVNQTQGAAVSAMSNTAERFARQTDKEFIHFLFIAKSSAAEVQSELYVALDQNYISKETFGEIYKLADDVSKLTSGFIKYLKTTLTSKQTQKTQ